MSREAARPPRRWPWVLAAVLLAAGAFAWLRPVTVLLSLGELRLRLLGVRSAEVQAGPHRLRYYEAGSGPPLVLVHGLASNALQDWGRLIPGLGRRYRVLAPDLPGFGASERPPDADYSIDMQVEAVRSFLAAKGVGRARVAGISMGGWIVSHLAGRYPDLVERLVVVAAAGMRPGEAAIPVDVLFPRDVEGVWRLVGAVRHKPPPTPAFVARDILARRLREEWIVRRAVESMGTGRYWLNGSLSRAAMPVLVVWGREDRLIPVAYADDLVAEFPRARLVVMEGCGHVPMADCPAAFDREMLGFLEEPAPPGS